MTRIRRHLSRLVLSGVGLFSLVGGLIGFGVVTAPNSDGTADVRTAAPPVVNVMSVDWLDGYMTPRAFIGRVEARQATDVAFERDGLLTSILVNEGDLVATGTVIATLDTARLDTRRVELLAARDRARADLELAELTHARVAAAREKGAVPGMEWDEVDKALAARAADLAQADAVIRSIDVEITKSTIRSPFDAVAARRHEDVGRVIDAGTPVVRLLERASPEVRIGVPDTAIESVTVGDHLVVLVGARELDGQVTAILPVRDRVSRGVDVILALSAEIDGIRHGDLARVFIKRTSNAPGFWVPLTALAEGGRGLWSVYIVDRDADAATGILLQQEVEVLHQQTDAAYVHGPIDNGVLIVRDGLHRVVPGMAARIGTTTTSLELTTEITR